MRKKAIIAFVIIINIQMIILLIVNVKSMVQKIGEKNIEEQGIMTSEEENSANPNISQKNSTSQDNAFAIQDILKIVLLVIGVMLVTLSGIILMQIR